METLEHMLLDCSRAKEIWKLAPVQWDGIKNLTGNFKNWWPSVTETRHRVQGKDHIGLTAYTLWQIWRSRNEKKFNSKLQDPS